MRRITAKFVKAAVALPFLSGAAAFALSINDPGVVGTVKDGSPASPTAETTYVVNLLSLGANTTSTIVSPNPIGSHTYKTGANDYAATSVTFGVTGGSGGVVPAGYQFVIAKYGNGNNNNGGDLVLFLNGLGITLPASEGAVFGDTQAHGLSGFTAFNATGLTLDGNPIPPAGGPVPDAGSTMALLGGGISALAFLRRRK